MTRSSIEVLWPTWADGRFAKDRVGSERQQLEKAKGAPLLTIHLEYRQS